jgi:hypothetical protein
LHPEGDEGTALKHFHAAEPNKDGDEDPDGTEPDAGSGKGRSEGGSSAPSAGAEGAPEATDDANADASGGSADEGGADAPAGGGGREWIKPARLAPSDVMIMFRKDAQSRRARREARAAAAAQPLKVPALNDEAQESLEQLVLGRFETVERIVHGAQLDGVDAVWRAQ